MHELVQPEGVSKSVDRVELTGDEHPFENIVVGESGHAQGIDVLIGHLVGVLRELDAELEKRLVLVLDRQCLDVRSFRRFGCFPAASYRPQEK